MTIVNEHGDPVESEPQAAVDQADGAVSEPLVEAELAPEQAKEEAEKDPNDGKVFMLIALDPESLRVVDIVANGVGKDIRDLLAVAHEATDFLQAKLALSHFKAMMTSVRPATGREVSAIQQSEQKRFLARR